MKFRKRPDILISLIAAKARFEFLTFITKQKLSAHFHPLRTNRSVRFGFGGCTVLLGSRGHQVSCYTTVSGNGVVLLKDNLPPWLKIYNSLSITKEARSLSPNSDLPAIKEVLNDRLNTHK